VELSKAVFILMPIEVDRLSQKKENFRASQSFFTLLAEFIYDSLKLFNVI